MTIAVGPWQVCDGSRLEVRSVVDAGESLTLQPCEKRVVRLVVLVRGICDDGQNPVSDIPGGQKPEAKGGKPPTGKTASAATTALPQPTRTRMSRRTSERFGCDVESCASAYADVRFEGCARPQRVAVVVHPATCDARRSAPPCDCGCCC